MDIHEKFMKQALKEAEVALLDNEFPVGCVITDGKDVIATGSRENSFENNELHHAEIVALHQLLQSPIQYQNSELTVYSTMEPCLMCFSTLVVNNIHKIVYAYEDVMGGGTSLPLELMPPLYKNMNVSIIPNVLRKESLILFKRFFADTNSNSYLNNSLLASYTLQQDVN